MPIQVAPKVSELRDVAEEQHAAAREPVGQVREQRRQERTRHELDDGDDPDAGRPDRRVGIQQDRDPRAELDGVEQEEGQLEAAEGRVAQDRPDDAQRGPELPGGVRSRAAAVERRGRPSRRASGSTSPSVAATHAAAAAASLAATRAAWPAQQTDRPVGRSVVRDGIVADRVRDGLRRPRRAAARRSGARPGSAPRPASSRSARRSPRRRGPNPGRLRPGSARTCRGTARRTAG